MKMSKDEEEDLLPILRLTQVLHRVTRTLVLEGRKERSPIFHPELIFDETANGYSNRNPSKSLSDTEPKGSTSYVYRYYGLCPKNIFHESCYSSWTICVTSKNTNVKKDHQIFILKVLLHCRDYRVFFSGIIKKIGDV